MDEPPGADAKERNLEETKKKLVEAIQVVVEANREMAEEERVGANAVNSLERCPASRGIHRILQELRNMTEYDIQFKPRASKDIEALQSSIQDRVLARIEAMSDNLRGD